MCAQRFQQFSLTAGGNQTKVTSLLSELGSRTRRLHELCIAANIEVNLSVIDAIDEQPLGYDEVRAICAAAPTQLDALSSSLLSSSRSFGQTSFTYLPMITAECIGDSAQLGEFVRSHSESLYGSVMQIGSFMGYTISAGDISGACAMINSLLNSGLGYVSSKTNKLLGLLPLNRSMILLSSPSACKEQGIPGGLCGLPKTLIKRIKDMGRIFRTKVKKPLSLRLNSDVTTAINLLKAHHGEDCWVSNELEQAWRLMARTTPPMFMVFELWYGDTMIAADFCHPVNGGASVYVATRFFDRSAEVRQMQPGFLLALAECQYLKSLGCLVWDLGGVNLCPLMRYKYDLAGPPIERPQSLFILSAAWSRHQQFESGNTALSGRMQDIKPGSIVENLSAADLLESE